MPILADIIDVLEDFAPLALQEGYDNAGLVLGDRRDVVDKALVSIDVTEAVVREAIEGKCGLIVSHHPVTLSGFKKLTGKTDSERAVLLAIKNGIAVYSAHTNLDSVKHGVSGMMAEKMGLVNCSVLEPRAGMLLKLVVFVPDSHVQVVRDAIFSAGAGNIGNYGSCSFNAAGTGTFMGNADTHPFAGKPNKLHHEAEIRVETVLPSYLKSAVLDALFAVHPYEEVAYDLYPLTNDLPNVGFGLVGDLEEPMEAMRFLNHLKDVFGCGCVRYTNHFDRPISRVALCGGSGSSLLKTAIAAGADVFVTGDFKYHQFFDADGRIVIADIGHFESERFTKELFFELLTKKIPNFAVRLSQVNSNPINYL